MLKFKRLNIIIRIKSFIKKRKQKAKYKILFENLEKHFLEQTSVPFSLDRIKNNGFLIKISGLYGYIPFNNMPWDYQYPYIWQKVFPYIEGKIFFGVISKFEKGKRSTIILKSVENQFKQYKLEESHSYQAIVLVKTKFGVFVDLGHSLRWNYGSIQGLVHNSTFESEEEFYYTQPGQVIEVFYYGKKKDGNLILSKTQNIKEWASGELLDLIGKEAPVTVIFDENNVPRFFLFGKIEAELQLSSHIYQKGQISLVKVMIKNLINREVILCTVLRVNITAKKVQIAFNNFTEIGRVLARNSIKDQSDQQKSYSDYNSANRTKIESLINDEVKDKLNLLNKTIVVEVVKKTDSFGRQRNAFLIDNKYFGSLDIVCKNYKMTESEKKKIKNNLPSGFFIEADIKSFDKRKMTVTWTITDEEFVHLSDV